MADTTYVDGSTLLTADTMNDLNRLHYTILSDPADAAAVRTALGVGTADSPQFTAVNVGHATDTTITRVSAGVIAVEGTNVLLSGGALGTPSSGTLTNCTGFPWTAVVKTADETVNNSSTLQDDDALTFAGTSGGTYAVRMVLNVSQISAAADLKIDFNSLNGNVSSYGCVWRMTDEGGVMSSGVVPLASTDISMLSAQTGQMFVEIYLNFTLSASVSCTLRWAQNTATVADTIIRKGSYLEYNKLI